MTDSIAQFLRECERLDIGAQEQIEKTAIEWSKIYKTEPERIAAHDSMLVGWQVAKADKRMPQLRKALEIAVEAINCIAVCACIRNWSNPKEDCIPTCITCSAKEAIEKIRKILEGGK